MKYQISYTCLTHTGRRRRTNQDNFLCHNHYLPATRENAISPQGTVLSKSAPLFGVFDGMGGERNGEVAAFLAVEEAAKLKIGYRPLYDLKQYCQRANTRICDHPAWPMGTTASLLAFRNSHASLCHIGDSKILRFRDGQLAQLTQDHVSLSAYGTKPPLSQYLGLPAAESYLEPQLERIKITDGDCYLICSDGLTDMLEPEQICNILRSEPEQQAAGYLLDAALAQGGRDNITLILCKIDRI